MAMNDRSLARPADAADAALDGRIAESLVIRGDVSGLSPKDRALFYVKLCAQLGLNPMTQPLQMLKLNGREILYPTRGATDQLASNHRINREIIEGPLVRDFAGTKLGYCVCRATHPNGRVETAVASLPVSGDIAMLPMKLETKAKRRATLSILGLGMLDEVEVESIPSREKSAADPIDLALAAAATPLDYLRDDLASASTPEGIRASYETHAREIAEMDEDGSAIRTARTFCHDAVVAHGFGTSRKDTDRILGKGERPVVAQPAPVADAPQSWREASLADLPSDSETTRALLGALRDAGDAAKVIACWREARDEVKSLPEKDAKGCFDALVARWAQLMPTDAYGVAEHAVREALKSPPDGPKPGRKPATKPAADAQGTAAEAAPSAGPQARAPHPESAPYVAADGAEAWAARVARYGNTIELRRSWERHVPAYRAAGVLEARRAVSVARLQALASIDDEAVAQRVLDDAERAADAAARVTSTARRTGRSEISVRREARDAEERLMKKVA